MDNQQDRAKGRSTGTSKGGAKGRVKGRQPKRTNSLTWVLAAVGVALVVVVILAIRQQGQQTPGGLALDGKPVSAQDMANLTQIPAPTWSQIGTKNAQPPIYVGKTDASSQKADVLYIGAEYCPYCAAARWSVVTALSRFGTFSGLDYSYSSAVDVYPSSPTFSFVKSQYSSPYINFQSVELQSNQRLADGSYAVLQKPTAQQGALIQKYDAPPYVSADIAGSIPFILMGRTYMWSGAPFSPSVLAGKAQPAIAATLPTAQGVAAQAILANANEMTATICALDGGKPANVCNSPEIQAAMAGLPKGSP